MRKRREGVPGQDTRTKFLLSIDEAATSLSLGRNTLYEMVLRGELSSIKIGRLRRVPVQAIQDFIGRHMEQEGA